MSVVELAVMPEADARRITERIRYTAMSVRDGVEKLQKLVAEAQEGQAHVALGYASWTAYLADVMGEEPLRLARDERREVVAWLSGEGMSTRAIAPIVGVDNKTVHNDLKRGVENSTPATADGFRVSDANPEPGFQIRDEDADLVAAGPQTGEGIDAPEPRAVTGLDGKSYKRPEPTTPRRRSLVDDAYTAKTALWQAVERIRAIQQDDRFSRNKEDIWAALQPSVNLANEILTDLENSIEGKSK